MAGNAKAVRQTLKAPSKRLVWFEDSAHMPSLEEPARCQAELVRTGEEFGL